MRNTPLLALAAAVAVTAALAGCSAQATPSASDGGRTASGAADVRLTGTFTGDNGKKVSGDVTIAGDTITLTGFSSDQGPDLHLYLATGTSEAETTAGVEIAPVAWDKSSQTFTVPSGTDVSTYTYLVEHCDKALAVFGDAPLSR